MSGDDYVDLKQHRATPEMIQDAGGRKVKFVSRKEQKRQTQFVKVPWPWVERLADAHHISSYRVALHVLHLHWKRHGQPFPLPNIGLCGVSRWRKWDALRELEQLGLIRVERRPRKSPLVIVMSP